MELEGNVKNYEWGKLGESSEVAKLVKANNENFNILNNTPYSELWMGDHGSGPSVVKSSGQVLGDVYKQRLPYLFKVLSVRKALSIQVHPNKEEATRLHKERPDLYKDPNHKPELAIALTPFMALCGFRPYSEIHRFCEEIPPLKELLGGDAVVNGLSNGSVEDFKKCYQTLMTADTATVSSIIDTILKDYDNVLLKYSLQDIFITINSDFPGDVGVLSLFFLNLLYLQPGESIYLGANEIHAYLSGDCIECMACSDNVIRAGLTPKLKDVKQLLASLNYTGSPASSKLFQPKELDENSKLFAPPIPDFAVVQISLSSSSPSASEYTLKLPQSPGILLVLSGSRTLRLKGHSDLVLKRGSIVFIPPENMNNIELLNLDKKNADFNAYLATGNSFN
ncbi:mannose-6-phosphate isomerase [Lucilia sericata]|uniref:mannose-6-phosphate isomerase n=1 Tax=Lucilia sericata TaxID=13632 RepID=UPI0018A869F7|nr:mannose-6-phosphate isomerase [Lucilia sericata]